MGEVDMVNHPPHYGSHPSGLDCIEVVRLMSFTLGNAVKYIWRAEDKNGLEDYLKAQWYLRDHIAHGASHYPPHKARLLLLEVLAAESCPRRKFLLQCIATGDLERAVAHIEMMARP